jgi:hypothetical protein
MTSTMDRFGVREISHGQRSGLAFEFAGLRVTPFIEAGMGLVAYSSSLAGEPNLGSALNLEDMPVFGGRWHQRETVGVRAIHYSFTSTRSDS